MLILWTFSANAAVSDTIVWSDLQHHVRGENGVLTSLAMCRGFEIEFARLQAQTSLVAGGRSLMISGIRRVRVDMSSSVQR